MDSDTSIYIYGMYLCFVLTNVNDCQWFELALVVVSFGSDQRILKISTKLAAKVC